MSEIPVQKNRTYKFDKKLLNVTEQFFISKIEDGLLTITPCGALYNTKTKKFVGAKSKTGRYCKYSLSENGRVGPIRHIQIHRLVWIWFKGPITKGLELNHKDTDKENNSLDNLEELTPVDNMRHARKNGLIPVLSGVNNPMSNLSQEDVDTIREMYSEGWSQKELARNYEVHVVTINNIVNFKTYK